MMRLVCAIFCVLVFSICSADESPSISKLQLPPGFSIELYAYPVPNARSMTLGPNNIVFVGSRSAGKVYAIVPDKNAPHGTKVITIASNLDQPNGVTYLNGSLYVAEISRIIRYDQILKDLNSPPKPIIVTKDLPDATYHGWRYLKAGPDHKLYITIGVPCNVCLSRDPRFGTVMRLNTDGSQIEIYTTGLRNSVGMDWDPKTGALWLTDNGRDWLGDTRPPDKLNHVPRAGMNFGFPYFDGKNMPNPLFGKLYPPADYTPPTFELPAHVAALGMVFYNGKQFPPAYQGRIFIAEHGSWNSTHKVGYQVITIDPKMPQSRALEPFITGWLQGNEVSGRPVDLLVMPDGSLLISDDEAGAIYRVTYRAP